ncbi:MAG: stage II sporulation protein D [Firmicutes bacterium]|nr:stage II sporulation protein D [Bacillota bacterium]
MFYGYEIEKINNEEILYLYLNLDTEFAILSKSKTTINKEINNYIKNNNIIFNGKKIVLIASGIILGTCLLSAPLLDKKNLSTDYNYTTSVLTLEDNFDNYNNIIENTKDFIIENESIESKTNSNISNNNFSNININKTHNEDKPELEESKINNTKKEISQNIKNEDKTTANTQMVSIKRSNGTILYMELEEYLVGVVAAEMPASFNIEALKAQAIAARTYAMKAINDNIILTDTINTQAYKDDSELKSMWGNNYQTYYEKIKQAVKSTKGLVIYYNNSLINAFYHSTSNGYTEDSIAVFGSYPYLKSVESKFDINVSSYLRTVSFSYEEISNKLKIPITPLSNIIIEKNSSNRVNKIIIDNNTYDGVKFRTLLGLRSTDFDITLNESDVSITTRGYGHGVGMSQYGANEYAKNGWNYLEILNHYYTDITIKSF